MDDAWKNGRIAAAAVAAALLMIAGGLMLRHRATPDTGAGATPPAGRTALPEIPSAVARSRVAAGQPSVDAFEVDFCGLGKVPLDKHDDFATTRFLESTTHGAWQRWLTAMLNSDDVRARAAGLLLQGKFGNGELLGTAMTEQNRDELVQLAVGAGDPAVYAMAVYACGTARAAGNSAAQTASGGSCSRISLRAWALLDPDNGVPWLSLATAARADDDAAGEADAFARAAAAKRFNSYNWSLLAFAQTDMPKETTPLERQYLTIGIMGVMAALQPPYAIATKHCTVEAMQEASVRDECNALAELMVAKATTLLESGIGSGLGARVGWPKQRVQELEQERDGLLGAQLQMSPQDATKQWTCGALERRNGYMDRFIAAGEIAAAREALEGSGKTALEMGDRWRRYWELLRKASQ